MAIARALMMYASIAALRGDHLCARPSGGGRVLEVLRRLKAEEGIAIVLATHDLSFASRAADRLVFFQDARSPPPPHPRSPSPNPTTKN